MKIAINTRLLLKNKLEGIGRFTFESLQRIVTQHPEHEFYFLFDRPFSPEFIFAKNITPVVLFPPARHPFLFVWWFEWSIKQWLKKQKMDLFLSPDGYLSLGTSCKSLAVIHDLNFEHYPKDLPLLQRWYYLYFFPKFAKKATRIATVSQFSANDISKRYGIDPAKIDVVYNGVNELFKQAETTEITNFKIQYTHEKNYFIAVGSIHPRKNLLRVMQAFGQFKQANREAQHKLLLVGERYWWNGALKAEFENHPFKTDILFTGRLSDEDLNIAISGAVALLYLSYFEGFGIPMLEAMRCETPVIAANTSCLPEIAQQAALFVDPFNVNAIEMAMSKIIKDTGLSAELKSKGHDVALQYSWQRTSELLWESICKTCA